MHEPTHIHGHTLDLVITRATDNIVSDIYTTRPDFTDHYPVHFRLACEKPTCLRKTITYRKLKSIDVDNFREDITNSSLLTDPVTDLFHAVTHYNTLLSELLDTHAPLITRSVSLRPRAPWFNDTIKEAKVDRRRLERTFRNSKLESDKEAYKEQCVVVNSLILSSKQSYFRDMVSDSEGDQKALHRIMDRLLHTKSESPLPSYDSAADLADKMAHFFIEKVETIRSDIAKKTRTEFKPTPRDTPTLSEFRPTTEDEVQKIISEAPSKWSVLDPIPTWLLKLCLEELLPIITKIVNLSLSSGEMPSNLKESILLPLLKKIALDPEIFNHFRPVSNLAFLSKVVEKVVGVRLRTHITENKLDDPFQSAYKQYHSTETALVRVCNDILLALDNHLAVLLILLDLSAAFDTVDHRILLEILSLCFGIKGAAFNWFKSYLSDRSERVSIDGSYSSSHTPTCGVPQGSVLGPLLFTCYIESLGELLRKHNMDYHLFADDSQLYIFLYPKDVKSILDAKARTEACIADVRIWLHDHFLKGNDDKTDMLLISSRYCPKPDFPDIVVGDTSIQPSSFVKNLGVIFDEHFTWEREVNNKVRESYFHIRNLGQARKYLTTDATETMVNAFVSSKLDYANALLVGLPKSLLRKLQYVQNSAARVIAVKRKCDHITPVLKSLHWLPVEKRCIFKVLLLTYKCLNGKGPKYLADLLTPKESQSYSLRSNSKGLLDIPPTKQKTYGDRAFSKAAPTLWNALPVFIRKSPSVDIFKSRLKTHLFQQHYR